MTLFPCLDRRAKPEPFIQQPRSTTPSRAATSTPHPFPPFRTNGHDNPPGRLIVYAVPKAELQQVTGIRHPIGTVPTCKGNRVGMLDTIFPTPTGTHPFKSTWHNLGSKRPYFAHELGHLMWGHMHRSEDPALPIFMSGSYPAFMNKDALPETKRLVNLFYERLASKRWHTIEVHRPSHLPWNEHA